MLYAVTEGSGGADTYVMGSTTLEALLACAHVSSDASACRHMHSPTAPVPLSPLPSACPSQPLLQPRARAAQVPKPYARGPYTPEPYTPAPVVRPSTLSAVLAVLILVNLALGIRLATAGKRSGAAAEALPDAVKEEAPPAPAASRYDKTKALRFSILKVLLIALWQP